ncbi:helix-turn-helix transcriptional regulator [Streptomyces sp. NPDC088674]|uniref:helix-turn-helix transcriptional regulator n=1 Tax=Streptomyces sp. NPDC088674 TaxID=3365869 RepID=UPI0037F2ECEB
MPRPKKYSAPPPQGCVWIDEAADRLGLSKLTLYKWKQEDYGPKPFKVGRKLTYVETDIDDFLQACRNPNADRHPRKLRAAA